MTEKGVLKSSQVALVPSELWPNLMWAARTGNAWQVIPDKCGIAGEER